MIIPHISENISYVPNHQPVIYILYHLRLEKFEIGEKCDSPILVREAVDLRKQLGLSDVLGFTVYRFVMISGSSWFRYVCEL